MPAVIRKPVYFSAADLEWLLALLHVHGDPRNLRKSLDEQLRAIKDEAERMGDVVKRANATCWYDRPSSVRPVPVGKKPKLDGMNKKQLDDLMKLLES